MAKFLIFSDIHIHPWSAFAQLTEDGLNSRLVSIIKLLRKILVVAQDENCDAILFSGDLFHVPKISVETYDLAARTIKSTKIPIVMIPGNHDEATKLADYHSMRALKGERIYVLDDREGRIAKISGVRIGGIPFTPDPAVLADHVRNLSDCYIVLCHTGFAGAAAGFDYIADQKNFVQPQDLKLKKMDIHLLVAGHFHQPQIYMDELETFAEVKEMGPTKIDWKTILIPGAPLQHTFGDRKSIRGCWLYDSRESKLEFKPLWSSKFVKGSWPLKEEQIKGNYVSCTVDKSDYEEAYEVLQGLSKGFSIQVQEPQTKEQNRLNITMESKQEVILKKYIRQNPPEDHLDPSKLIKLGGKLLAKAEREN